MFSVTKYLLVTTRHLGTSQDGFGESTSTSTRQGLGPEVRSGISHEPRYRFGEEELLNFAYHYSAMYLIRCYGLSHTYAYSLGADKVFEDFLRPALQGLRNQPETLKCFVTNFVHDFAAVAQSLSNVLAKSPHQPALAQCCNGTASRQLLPILIGLNACPS